MAQYERTINAQVLDISKSTISRDLVTQSSGWEGAVIAKTDLNCGGWKEHDLGTGSTVPDANYLIFSSLGEVPDHIWQDSRFVVEKFLPEMRDGLYCLRTWMFLGDAETNSLSYSKSAIVKQHTVLRRVPTPRVPDELREIRKQLNFDFGKFDYALVDGRVVLYDANRTPSLGTFTRSEIRPRIEMLAAGLRSFL